MTPYKLVLNKTKTSVIIHVIYQMLPFSKNTKCVPQE